MNNKTTDFTQGSIPRHLISFSIPMFLGNLLQSLYNVVNSIWVGRFLGADALAAVSVGFPIIFTIIALIMGITMASTTLVAQYYGAKRRDMLARTIGNSMILVTVSGVAATIVGIAFNRQLLILVNVPPDILDMASAYLVVFFSGLLGMFWYNVSSAILRGLEIRARRLNFWFMLLYSISSWTLS